MTDRSKNQDPISPAQRADSDPTGPLKAPPPPPPPAPLPRREEEVEGLDPDEEVVLLDDEPEEELTCGQVNSGPRMSGGRSRKSTSKAARPAGEERPRNFTPTQRLLILDVWGRSGLAGSDFAPLVSISPAALYKWKRLFEEQGPAGLEERRGASTGSKLSEVTRRTILLLKKTHPDWGQDRIHHELQRSQGLSASASAIARVLTDEGYVVEAQPTRPHGAEPKRFERARPGELWQTDLFTFRLPRQNRAVHLVAFMDDHSRFVVGYGLHATASGALVREVFEAAIAAYGAPKEVLTDNGPQYVTWRGTSEFSKLCQRRGIKHVVAKPRRPQTLGKAERLWASLWNECLEVCPRRGVPTLRARHPELGARELEELAARFRSVRTTRKRDTIAALTWHVPGSVWAVDFSDAGLDIEGTFPYLLLVRDLASGYTLLSLPCRAQDAATVCAALDALFASERPPLVLKADNGSGFIAEATVDLLAAHEVLLLRSPPGTPAFNGACEAGGGSIKTRAHHVATARGRVTCWSCDDVEAARIEANETCRARLADPTPGERWRARSPLAPDLRAALRADVVARTAAGLLELEGDVEDRAVQQVVRAAVAGSLLAHSPLSSHLESIPARRGPRRTDKRVGQPEGVASST